MAGAEIPRAVRELVAGMADLFARDQPLGIELNDAAGRPRRANQRLWDGLHPDALGLMYDEQAPAGGFPSEFISRSSVVQFDADSLLDRTVSGWASCDTSGGVQVPGGAQPMRT